MQKAFPKVVLAVLVVIVLGVMLIAGLTGDGPASDRALRTVLIAVGVGVVFLVRHLWKRRRGRAPLDEHDRSRDDDTGQRDET